MSIADNGASFARWGIKSPPVLLVRVAGNPVPVGDRRLPTWRNVLDVQVAGSIAPAATIVVYQSMATERGFVTAIGAAVHDQMRRPSVISISWVNHEERWTDQAISVVDGYFADGRHSASRCVARRVTPPMSTTRPPAPTPWRAAAPSCPPPTTPSSLKRCGTTAPAQPAEGSAPATDRRGKSSTGPDPGGASQTLPGTPRATGSGPVAASSRSPVQVLSPPCGRP